MSAVVIVGTGQAGFQVAASLRDGGLAGPIVMVGDEGGLPYQRPPLSKAYLDGKADEETLSLRPASFFAEHGIELRAGETVTAIDREARAVALGSGDRIGYRHLVLATGAHNRPLPVPGVELDGVLQLRTLPDAAELKRRLAGARHAVVVGAGFIGLEFAAVAAARGVGVTVFEATDRPMSRALSREMSAFFLARHEAAGIRFVLGGAVDAILGAENRVTGVETLDGRHFPADLVLVGIGVIPNADLAREAGLAVGNGIVVDETLLTSDPDISAIGDCAYHPSRFAHGGSVRVESVQNAVDQARCVAARLTGRPAPYDAVPWFWSDQGPLKLQIAGLSSPHDEAVLRGDPGSGSFSVFCFGGGGLVGVESVNRPADHMVARRLLANRVPLTADQARDAAFDLRALASRPAGAPVT